MEIKYTDKELSDFELEIIELFENKKVKGPVHLSGGNESKIIEIFKEVHENDWVFSTWRSHFHCLLKGIPKETIKKDIMEGKSITLHYPEYKLFTSAIVSGIVPIALGVAYEIKRKNIEDEMVWCFIGDMTSETGCFHESYKYSINFDLPIIWVIEDNKLSTNVNTKEVWNLRELTHINKSKIIHYI